jgi:hypothetical protein
MSHREITAEIVAELLNDAVSNEYDLREWSVEDICLDLIAFSEDCEDSSVEQLTPFVKAWKYSF